MIIPKTFFCWVISLVLTFLPAVVFAATEGGHGPEGIPTKPLIYAGINFLILILVLGYFLRKPVKEFFASRAALIKKNIELSQALRNEAAKKYAEYEARLKGIEAEMSRLIAQLKKDGNLEKERILRAAQEQMVGLGETSKRVMDQEIRRAKEELKEEAAALAASLAEELVRKNITPEDQRRLLEEYLERMERLS